MTSIPIFPSTAIDFASLISELSTPTNSRSALKVRNRLLSPWTIPSLPSLSTSTSISPKRDSHSSSFDLSCQLLSGVSADPDPWSAFKRFQPGLEIYILGAPPRKIIRSGYDSDFSATDHNKGGIWSVIIFAPALPMPDRPSGPRIDLWFSTQAFTSDPSHPQSRVATLEADLLRHFMQDWLMAKLNGSEEHQDADETLEDRPEVVVTLCGIDQRICDLLNQWAGATQTDRERRDSLLPNWQVEWSGSYVSYVKEPSQDDLNAMIVRELQKEQGAKSDLIEGRWQLERIEEHDIDLVQSTNKLPFPREYVQSHLAHSIMLIDTMTSTVEGQEKGKGAGWVYQHDDLALASLHVPQPYRRIISSSANSNSPARGKGVGTILMELVTPRVGLVQKYALKKSGNAQLLARDGHENELLTPCVTVTEVGNVAARSLFSKCGFVENEKVAWIGLRMKG